MSRLVEIKGYDGDYFISDCGDVFFLLNHIDGNKLNNNYDNLEWCTLSYNTKEAIRLGLFKIRKGEESNLYSGKINNDVAKTIRDMRNNRNMSYGEIADIFDLSRATIINICKNRIYT